MEPNSRLIDPKKKGINRIKVALEQTMMAQRGVEV
jgi:hypothetical protein